MVEGRQPGASDEVRRLGEERAEQLADITDRFVHCAAGTSTVRQAAGELIQWRCRTLRQTMDVTDAMLQEMC